MSYSTLPISFWGYALKTAMHILNLVHQNQFPTHLRNCGVGASLV